MQKIKWKPHYDYSIYGNPVLKDGELLTMDETLLQRIETMPEGKKISFAESRRLYSLETRRMWTGEEVNGKAISDFMGGGWVQFLIEKGYQIMLDDTEYEILETAA